MTILVIAIALLAGVSLLLGWYFRELERGAVKALPVWERANANLNRLVLDDSVPDSVVRELTIYAAIAGCGCVALAIGLEMGRRELSESYCRKADAKPTPADLRELGPAQRQLLAALLKDLVRIDMLRSPIIRLLLKAWLKNILKKSVDAKGRSRASDIQPLMNAAHGAAEWQNRRRKLPDPVAPLAQTQLEPA
jgi:hypothetical protein